jgi:hypothetical protein
VRSIIFLTLALPLGACAFLDQINFDGSSLNPHKVYLNRVDVISVPARETYRYACVDQPLLCVQHGIAFECRCP